MRRFASSPSLVRRINPVESASRRPTGYSRRGESTSSTTAGRRPGSRAVETTPAGLLSIQTSRGSGRTGRPSMATPLSSSTSRAGSLTRSPATVICPAAISSSARRRDATPQWARYLARRIAPRASAGPLLAGLQQPFAKLALVLGRGVETGWVRELVEARQAEELLEEGGRPVDDRAEA